MSEEVAKLYRELITHKPDKNVEAIKDSVEIRESVLLPHEEDDIFEEAKKYAIDVAENSSKLI